jgi:type I restriction enzyme S subunit
MIQENKISDFAEVITGGTPSTTKKEYWDGGKIPWLNSGELNKKYIYESRNFITELGLKNSSTRLMPPDTVLIALTGATCGLSALSKIEACANQSVTGILPSKSHIPEYLFHFLRTQRQRILDKAWGNAQPHISQAFVKDFKVPLPSLSDQLHIANILSKAENLIAQRKESIRLLDEFLKSTFLEMFGDAVKNEKKWNKSELKNYAKVRIGPFGSLLHREDYVQNGVPLVNPSHIGEGKILIDPELTISKNKMKELSAYVMHEGDVVLGRRGEIGRCAVVTKKEQGYLCGTGSIYIRPTEELNPIFLYNIISSVSMRRVLENSAKGITMKNLNSGIIENLKIPVPPIELQTQFAQIVEKTETLKSQYQQSWLELEHLYGSLSQKAFRGELGI